MASHYVDPSGGSDANGGTSWGDAWATLQKAIDTVTGTDIVINLANTAELIRFAIENGISK